MQDLCFGFTGSVIASTRSMRPAYVRSSALLTLVFLGSACASTPRTTAEPLASRVFPERAVRRDLPLTPAMRRAYARGTRDSSGAPARNYFQQNVDYRIDATLDPKTNQVRGSETITLHNTTPDTLKTIVVRLYQNYFTPRVERTDYVTDITDGITIERLSVNGNRISLTNEKQYDLDARIATVTPPAPILPGATATIET